MDNYTNDKKDEIIALIENVPYSVTDQINKSWNDTYDINQLWGLSVENHVRDIVSRFPGVSIINEKREDFFFKNFMGEYVTKIHNNIRLCFNQKTGAIYVEDLSLEKKKRAREIDLLFEMGDEIVIGEIKYTDVNNHVSISKFKRLANLLAEYFPKQIEPWMLFNRGHMQRRKRNMEDSSVSQDSLWYRLVEINVTIEDRKEFNRLFKERKLGNNYDS